MNLQPRIDKWGPNKQSWLGSRHGTDVCQTVTLNIEKFTQYEDIIPSGVPLKKAADGGLYEPLTTPASEQLAGFLFTAQPKQGTTAPAPMLWHGRIKLDNLPEGAPDLTTLGTPNPQFTLESKED